jgi:hypothetical protein
MKMTDSIKPGTMQNLIETISNRAELNKEKTTEVLLLISEHVKSEFPLLHSVVDLVLGTQGFFPQKQSVRLSDFPENHALYN